MGRSLRARFGANSLIDWDPVHNLVMVCMSSRQIPGVMEAPGLLDDARKMQGVMARDELMHGTFVFAADPRASIAVLLVHHADHGLT